MKPIQSASFKGKILTIWYPDHSFKEYYLDGNVWRKMPSMKMIQYEDTEVIALAYMNIKPKDKTDQLTIACYDMYEKETYQSFHVEPKGNSVNREGWFSNFISNLPNRAFEFFCSLKLKQKRGF